ncbi:hypothetical protein BN946_scf184808.g5 [Trametes cinnabarina]|uniref:Uncharacterized protein n=1 Tax=Pycnoporus cinnabarinus TaxID=5643 RepID=A0A060SSM8_PYCCI|nr:hypothetical protein BN946_scf184808.g5 [Trametes cinnabarina]
MYPFAPVTRTVAGGEIIGIVWSRQTPPLRFRASVEGDECYSSESFLLPYDFRRIMGLERVFVNPLVINGYVWKYYVWHKWVLRQRMVKWFVERVWDGAWMQYARMVVGDPKKGLQIFHFACGAHRPTYGVTATEEVEDCPETDVPVCASDEDSSGRMGLERVFVNPLVINGYVWKYYMWHKWVLRQRMVKWFVERVWDGAWMQYARMVVGDPKKVWVWDGIECHPW